MAKKKVYKGIVTSAFNTGGKEYKVGDEYKSTCKKSIEILINAKRIK